MIYNVKSHVYQSFLYSRKPKLKAVPCQFHGLFGREHTVIGESAHCDTCRREGCERHFSPGQDKCQVCEQICDFHGSYWANHCGETHGPQHQIVGQKWLCGKCERTGCASHFTYLHRDRANRCGDCDGDYLDHFLVTILTCSLTHYGQQQPTGHRPPTTTITDREPAQLRPALRLRVQY